MNLQNKKTAILISILTGTMVLVGYFLFVLKLSLSPPSEEQSITTEDLNEVVAKLDTPQKLAEYLNKNFVFEEREEDQSMTPEEFFKAKKGNRNDLATFLSFALYQHDYFATILRCGYIDQENKEGIRTVTLFRKAEDEAVEFIDLEDSKLKIFSAGDSADELFENLEKRHQIKITKYAAFTSGSVDLTTEDWFPR